MAMNGNLMGTEIKTAIEGVTGETLPQISEDMWKVIATAITDHLTLNVVVVTPDTKTGTIS